MRVPIVNEQDEIIEYKDRKDRNPKEIIRVAALWVMNEKKEFLIAQRSKKEEHEPNIWGPSVAGTVEEGETYEQNIRKEAQEEIGVTLDKVALGPKERKSTSHEYFGQFFFANLDSSTKFTPLVGEVDEVRWVSISDLEKWHQDKPQEFTPSFGKSIIIAKNYATQN